MRKMNRAILSGLLLTSLAAAKPMFADTIVSFSLSLTQLQILPVPPPYEVYTFSLPSSPTNFSSPVGSDFFAITNIAITSNPGSPTIGTVFFILAPDGGLYISSPAFQLGDIESEVFFTYTGTFGTSSFAPTFTPGVYPGLNQDSPDTESVTVTISQSPEPSSLALFGTGMLGLVGVVRRKLTT